MYDLDSMVNAIAEAYERAQTHPQGPRCTPLEYSPSLSAACGARVHLKCEHLQATGSFKFRGAFNKLARLSAQSRATGVVAASTGNHGMGVARAGQLLGLPTTIYLPEQTSPMKRAAIAAMGARIVAVPGDCLRAEQAARAAAEAERCVFVSPYNDLEVMAGQGTIAAELVNQLSEPIAAVYVAVGGGGLIGGIGSYLSRFRPKTRVIGCWPEQATTMLRSLEAGRIIEVEEGPTLSDATAGGLEPDSVTFPACQRVIADTRLVSEAAIAAAMIDLAREERWLVEGAAGLALAACLADAQRFPGQNLVVVLCGRNIALEKWVDVLAQSKRGNAFIKYY